MWRLSLESISLPLGWQCSSSDDDDDAPNTSLSDIESAVNAQLLRSSPRRSPRHSLRTCVATSGVTSRQHVTSERASSSNTITEVCVL